MLDFIQVNDRVYIKQKKTVIGPDTWWTLNIISNYINNYGTHYVWYDKFQTF